MIQPLISVAGHTVAPTPSLSPIKLGFVPLRAPVELNKLRATCFTGSSTLDVIRAASTLVDRHRLFVSFVSSHSGKLLWGATDAWTDHGLGEMKSAWGSPGSRHAVAVHRMPLFALESTLRDKELYPRPSIVYFTSQQPKPKNPLNPDAQEIDRDAPLTQPEPPGPVLRQPRLGQAPPRPPQRPSIRPRGSPAAVQPAPRRGARGTY